MHLYKTLLAPLLVALAGGTLSALGQVAETPACQEVCHDPDGDSCLNYFLNDSKTTTNNIPLKPPIPGQQTLVGRWRKTRYEVGADFHKKEVTFAYINDHDGPFPNGPFRVNIHFDVGGSRSYRFGPPYEGCEAVTPPGATTIVAATALYVPKSV